MRVYIYVCSHFPKDSFACDLSAGQNTWGLNMKPRYEISPLGFYYTMARESSYLHCHSKVSILLRFGVSYTIE